MLKLGHWVGAHSGPEPTNQACCGQVYALKRYIPVRFWLNFPRGMFTDFLLSCCTLRCWMPAVWPSTNAWRFWFWFQSANHIACHPTVHIPPFVPFAVLFIVMAYPPASHRLIDLSLLYSCCMLNTSHQFVTEAVTGVLSGELVSSHPRYLASTLTVQANTTLCGYIWRQVLEVSKGVQSSKVSQPTFRCSHCFEGNHQEAISELCVISPLSLLPANSPARLPGLESASTQPRSLSRSRECIPTGFLL